MSDIQITIKRKSYHPGSASIIENFSLLLPAHEFICLVGHNGCGKTTLLNCVAGLDKHFEGEICVVEKHTQPKIGYIFQNTRLLPWRTVRENIELVLEPQAFGIIDDLLETMQLSAVQHEYPERQAGGIQRKVAITRAFAVNPDLLLMDEPFVALDPSSARDFRGLLLKLWQQRPHTVLFVTHDLREAITLADRLVFLSTRPMSVISEIKVPIARSERHNEAAIETFRQQLKNNHPEINHLL